MHPLTFARGGPGLRKTGLSLIELLFAVAFLAAFVAPIFSLLRPSEVRVSSASSQASRLFYHALDRLLRLSRKELKARLATGRETPGGHHEMDLGSLLSNAGPGRPAPGDGGPLAQLAAGLDARLAVRVINRVHGRLGLDRLDVKMTYSDSRRQRVLTHSTIRRNDLELEALGALRLSGELETLTDAEIAAEIRSFIEKRSGVEVVRNRRVSRFVVPLFPVALERFQGPEPEREARDRGDPDREGSQPGRDEDRPTEDVRQDRVPVDEDYFSEEPFVRPTFPASDSICL